MGRDRLTIPEHADVVVWGRLADGTPHALRRMAARELDLLALRATAPARLRLSAVHRLHAPGARAGLRGWARGVVRAGVVVELVSPRAGPRVLDAVLHAAGGAPERRRIRAGAGGTLLLRVRLEGSTQAVLRVARAAAPGDPADRGRHARAPRRGGVRPAPAGPRRRRRRVVERRGGAARPPSWRPHVGPRPPGRVGLRDPAALRGAAHGAGRRPAGRRRAPAVARRRPPPARRSPATATRRHPGDRAPRRSLGGQPAGRRRSAVRHRRLGRCAPPRCSGRRPRPAGGDRPTAARPPIAGARGARAPLALGCVRCRDRRLLAGARRLARRGLLDTAGIAWWATEIHGTLLRFPQRATDPRWVAENVAVALPGAHAPRRGSQRSIARLRATFSTARSEARLTRQK